MEAEKAKAIWESIILEAKNPKTALREDEMTIKTFMEMSGFGREKARKVLQIKVEQGILVVEDRYVGRTTCKVYRPVLK